jgi:Ca2+-binding RTX toxin-like protein
VNNCRAREGLFPRAFGVSLFLDELIKNKHKSALFPCRGAALVGHGKRLAMEVIGLLVLPLLLLGGLLLDGSSNDDDDDQPPVLVEPEPDLEPTEGADLLFGTSADDQIAALGGNDSVRAFEGDDQVFGGIGFDQLFGGDGNDTLDGERGADQLYGGAGSDGLLGGLGNDTLYGGESEDELSGGDGDDVVIDDAGTDFLFGDEGNDLLRAVDSEATATRDELFGGAGNDTLVGDRADEMIGAEGDDLFVIQRIAGLQDETIFQPVSLVDFNPAEDRIRLDLSGYDSATVELVADPDTEGTMILVNSDVELARVFLIDPSDFPLDRLDIVNLGGPPATEGTEGPDTIEGGTGADSIRGLGGNDLIDALGGNDSAQGGQGADRIFGGDGDDSLEGNGGNDLIDGGDGADELFGQFGNDTLRGRTGNDTLLGGTGDDLLDGGADNDILIDYEGADSLFGGAGSDALAGFVAARFSPSGQFLSGGTDNDMLGGDRLDTMTGGEGEDSFVLFDVGDGAALITDFDPALDSLRIIVDGEDGADTSGLEVLRRPTPDGGGLEIVVAGEVQAILQQVRPEAVFEVELVSQQLS